MRKSTIPEDNGTERWSDGEKAEGQNYNSTYALTEVLIFTVGLNCTGRAKKGLFVA